MTALKSLADTQRFAHTLAHTLKAGDCLGLTGDLGAGKTTLARFIIQALCPDAGEIPSPTFTLVQTYETKNGTPLWHVDLYRLAHADELEELGLEEALEHAITIIEWPQIAASILPASTHHLILTFDPATGQRHIRSQQQFLKRCGWENAAQEPLKGDASFRRYIRLRRSNETAMLMDAPPEKESVAPFCAVARYLSALGYSAPRILAEDHAQGFLLLEDIGDDTFTRILNRDEAQEPKLYEAAVDLLIEWHARATRAQSALTIPEYDHALLMREVSLFTEWFFPTVGKEKLAPEFTALWEDLLTAHPLPCTHFVHRDYHADNLMWLAREGNARVGLLDFQDGVWGHPAYDLVSLLEDARRDIAPEVAAEMRRRYCDATHQNHEEFARSYALLGAQRNLKIIGIFHRLNRRDGKPHYLRYLPRVWGHLAGDLAHPALKALSAWLTHQNVIN